MKLSIIPKKYGEELTCEGIGGIPISYRNKLVASLSGNDSSVDVTEVNYGRGADWIWLLLTIYGSYKLVVEGDKIDKGINGWANVLKRLKKLFKKSSFVKLDSDALLLFAVDEVFQKNKGIRELVFISKSEIDIQNNSGLFFNRPKNDFTSTDDAYSIFVLKSDTGLFFIIGARINGEVEILKKIKVDEL